MKTHRATRWARRKARHRKDGNHSRRGYLGGNPRYNGKGSWQRHGLRRPAPGQETRS